MQEVALSDAVDSSDLPGERDGSDNVDTEQESAPEQPVDPDKQPAKKHIINIQKQ